MAENVLDLAGLRLLENKLFQTDVMDADLFHEIPFEFQCLFTYFTPFDHEFANFYPSLVLQTNGNLIVLRKIDLSVHRIVKFL